MNDFPLLPPELQAHVLSYRPELGKQYSQTSQLVSGLTSNIYLEELCQRPISEKEVTDYINTRPTTLGLFSQEDNNSEIIYGGGPATRIYMLGEHLSRCSLYYLNGSDYIDSVDITSYTRLDPIEELSENLLNYIQQRNINYENIRDYGIINLGPGSSLSTSDILNVITGTTDINSSKPRMNYSYELDFASEYNIYQRRLGCKIRDSDFGKKEILNKLDLIYRNSKRTDIDALIRCYLRLYVESRIYNIYPKSILPNIEDEYYIPTLPLGENYLQPTAIPRIYAEIERLYPIIRKRLQCL